MRHLLTKFCLSAKELGHAVNLCVASMLLSLRVILGFFTILVTDFLKIGFSFLATAISGMLYGPLVAAAVGGLGDILSYLVNPVGGAYFPGFTVSGIVMGLIYGLFLYKEKITLVRVLLCEVTVIIVVNLLLNSLWLYIMLGNKTFIMFVAARFVKEIIMAPINVAMLYTAGKAVSKLSLNLHRHT